MTLWAAGAAASFAQMLIGWAALERLRRRAHACDMPGFEAMRKLLEIENEVRLLETANGSMPIMYGLFSPVIFLPADATEWNAERRRVVLLHELAHVRRRDGATHLLARTALVFYWWNPLAWTAWRLFLKERERAADDLVLGAGADAPEYAGHLLEIARSMQLPAAFGWAAIAMARRPQLEDRLLAILDSARDRTTPHRGSALALSLAAIGILVPVAALQAKSDTGQAAAVSQATAGSAAALIEEGDAARGHHRFDEAKKLYGRALKAAGGSGPEAATALIDRGEIELAAKDHALAEDDFEKAEAADSGKASDGHFSTASKQPRRSGRFLSKRVGRRRPQLGFRRYDHGALRQAAAPARQERGGEKDARPSRHDTGDAGCAGEVDEPTIQRRCTPDRRRRESAGTGVESGARILRRGTNCQV
jgi:tetratricopeptide (TPR) repeat protein